jgi:hypothetical protein
MKALAKTLGVSRSDLHDRVAGRTRPRRRHHEAQDAAALPMIMALVAARPTYGDLRIAAILNRQLRAQELAPVNHKRVYRIMQANNLLLARRHTERPANTHDGKIIVMRSNLRWCSDGFELARLGTGTSSAAPSSSTLTTARSSPGAPWRTRASAARMSAT